MWVKMIVEGSLSSRQARVLLSPLIGWASSALLEGKALRVSMWVRGRGLSY
jgi:hypothetical protein